MRKQHGISWLLVGLFCLAMVFPAFADGNTTYSVTVNNASAGCTYTLYKLADLNYWQDATKYHYTVCTEWVNFFNGNTSIEMLAPNTANPDTQYPNWKNVTIGNDGKPIYNASEVRAFAQSALNYALNNHVTSFSSEAAQNVPYSISGLTPGYYLLSSSKGNLLTLFTVENQNVTVDDKNEVPTVEKKVFSDAAYTADSDGNKISTASIGDTLYFRSVITVGAGTTGYVFHDAPEEGITLNLQTLRIQGLLSNGTYEYAGVGTYDLNTAPNHTCTSLTSPCAFHIDFEDSYIDTVSEIVITYEGTLNKKAKVVGVAGSEENKNSVVLAYNNGTDTSYTNTKTYGFDLIKQNVSGEILSGAEFKLYDSATGGNEIRLTLDAEKGYYRPAYGTETPVGAIVTTDQPIRVVGLNNGTYYLEETQAPAHYNQLEARHPITINEASIFKIAGNSTSGVPVLNQMGVQLPSTGGMGTTLFYLIGGALVAAALVLLIAKKRMEHES